MKQPKRSERRHQRQRMVRKAERVMASWSSRPSGHAAQRMADNLRICSCYCCSQRKRWMSGPSMQERRALLRCEDAA